MANKSLFMQDIPSSPDPTEAQKSKSCWRVLIFKSVFKAIEAIWMVVQIVQYLFEIFRT